MTRHELVPDTMARHATHSVTRVRMIIDMLVMIIRMVYVLCVIGMIRISICIAISNLYD